MAAKDHLGTIGAIASAAIIGSCCLTPTLFLLFGTTVGALGALHVLEPYRTYFTAAGFGFWGYGFYRLYLRRAAGACAGACERRPLAARVFLWMALGGLVAAIVYPKLVLFYVGS